MGTIEITTEYSAITFFYCLARPNYIIDGRIHQRPWGTEKFVVTPGRHRVHVSYPWLLGRHLGMTTMEVDVLDGATVRLRYRAGLTRHSRGKLTLEDPLPRARVV